VNDDPYDFAWLLIFALACGALGFVLGVAFGR
jgi:hypothetical protein